MLYYLSLFPLLTLCIFFFPFKGPQGPQGPVGFPGPKGPNVSSCSQSVFKLELSATSWHFSSNNNTVLWPDVFYKLSTSSPPGPTRKRWAAWSPRTEGRDGEWVVSSMNALCHDPEHHAAVPIDSPLSLLGCRENKVRKRKNGRAYILCS